jgi:hypothetical protein
LRTDEALAEATKLTLTEALPQRAMLIGGIWTLIWLPQPWWDRSGYAKALQVWSARHLRAARESGRVASVDRMKTPNSLSVITFAGVSVSFPLDIESH